MNTFITTEFVRQLRIQRPSTNKDYWDARMPRLILRARSSGQHSYLVSLGRGKWFTLGRVEALTPAQARKEAQKRLGEVACGQDPIRAKRRERQRPLDEYVERVYEPWIVGHRRSGAKIIAQMRAVFIPTLGKLRLDDKITIRETQIITGGTGRFNGASSTTSLSPLSTS